MHADLTFYTVLFRKFGFRCQVSGKVDAIAYPESASGGTPETKWPKRGIKIG
jgi:hypothetical protein